MTSNSSLCHKDTIHIGTLIFYPKNDFKIVSRSIYNLKSDTIYMYYIPFDRSFHQLSNGIGHVVPSTDRKLELTAKSSMAQPVSQTAVCSNSRQTSGYYFTSH